MSEISTVAIDERYLIRDKSSSDGSQIKYFFNNNWYKIDYYGGEATSERLASLLLECTNLESNKFVRYSQVCINGEAGCESRDFRNNDDEEFITFYRLYKNIYGHDLATITSRMDYDDAIKYVIDFIGRQTGLDVTTYLANTFWLDSIILNTDRHFNNYGILVSGEEYREAPIFDNGKSLLTGTDICYEDWLSGTKKVYSKSFSPSFDLNYSFLKNHCSIELDKSKLKEELSKCGNSLQRKVLEHQLDL